MVAAVVSLTRGRMTWAPVAAAALATLAAGVGLHGVDLPAAVYRVDLFQRQGLAPWDSQWYGGHWTLNYTVIFPPIASALGIGLTEVLSAGVAAWMFDRLAIAHFGARARAGSLLFALGTLAQVAIGQLPYLLGEAFALGALWALSRRRHPTALALAVGASLASPLAGAFLGLAAAAYLIGAWPQRRLAHTAIGLASILPALALTAVFPGQGAMPFPALDFVVLLLLVGVSMMAIPSQHRGLRIAVVLYLLAIVASFALPTAVGGNISRLGECVGAPLATCVLWPQRRRLLVLIAIPMALLQWGPAVGTAVRSASDQSAKASYFGPVLTFLKSHNSPKGRVEVVPTAGHWEAAYVAPFIPLARGWERQLDTADNPLFYDGSLGAASYRAWLLDNGVRYVALPDVALDYAATTETRLLSAGVPGLRQVWHNPHWRVFAVSGAPGILSGPAEITQIDGSTISIHVFRPAQLLLRARYSLSWRLAAGQACLEPSPGGWIAIKALHSGDLGLRLSVGSAGDECTAATA